MTSIDNESPPGSWRDEIERMPWKYSQNEKVDWALAAMRMRGMWTEASILAQEINVLKAELEAERARCAADVYNALLEAGQPDGVRKVAVDAIKSKPIES